MEFRCPHCEHIGPAAEVRPGEEGVEVVCESCSVASPLEGDVSEHDGSNDELTDPSSERDINLDELEADRNRARDGSGLGASEPGGPTNVASIPEEALDELVPEPDADHRCPKCASPLPGSGAEHCAECGLNLEKAERYDEGDAPWERPDPGREDDFEEAHRLWDEATSESEDTTFQSFVEHVRAHGLFGLGIRKLRFYLVDHPDDHEAIEALRELATGMEARIVAARAEAEAEAEELQDEISRFKRFMTGVVLVLWVLAMTLFADLFLGWDVL